MSLLMVSTQMYLLLWHLQDLHVSSLWYKGFTAHYHCTIDFNIPKILTCCSQIDEHIACHSDGLVIWGSWCNSHTVTWMIHQTRMLVYLILVGCRHTTEFVSNSHFLWYPNWLCWVLPYPVCCNYLQITTGLFWGSIQFVSCLSLSTPLFI